MLVRVHGLKNQYLGRVKSLIMEVFGDDVIFDVSTRRINCLNSQGVVSDSMVTIEIIPLNKIVLLRIEDLAVFFKSISDLHIIYDSNTVKLI